MVWIASATTAQLFSRSAFNLGSFKYQFAQSFFNDLKQMVCAIGTPMFRNTVCL